MWEEKYPRPHRVLEEQETEEARREWEPFSNTQPKAPVSGNLMFGPTQETALQVVGDANLGMCLHLVGLINLVYFQAGVFDSLLNIAFFLLKLTSELRDLHFSPTYVAVCCSSSARRFILDITNCSLCSGEEGPPFI